MQTTHRLTEPSSTPSQVKLYCVFAEDLDPIWDEVSVHIQSALQYSDGKYSLLDIKKEIEEKKMQLFLAVDDGVIAVGVTQISDYPQKRVLTIVLVGGSRMEEWLHLMNQLEAWGIDNGCEQIELYGRPGWEKVLGWEKTYIALKKNLNEVKH